VPGSGGPLQSIRTRPVKPLGYPAFIGATVPNYGYAIDPRDWRSTSAAQYRTWLPRTWRISRIVTEKSDDTAIAIAVEAFTNEVKDLVERDQPPQFVICALPVEIIERVSNMRSLPSEEDADDESGDEVEAEDLPAIDREIENFRGAPKAATLALERDEVKSNRFGNPKSGRF
jgi:hypothetical protein